MNFIILMYCIGKLRLHFTHATPAIFEKKSFECDKRIIEQNTEHYILLMPWGSYESSVNQS